MRCPKLLQLRNFSITRPCNTSRWILLPFTVLYTCWKSHIFILASSAISFSFPLPSFRLQQHFCFWNGGGKWKYRNNLHAKKFCMFSRHPLRYTFKTFLVHAFVLQHTQQKNSHVESTWWFHRQKTHIARSMRKQLNREWFLYRTN